MGQYEEALLDTTLYEKWLFKSRQRQLNLSHAAAPRGTPRTSSTPLPALPHCPQGSPRAPFAQSSPEQPNIYAFTYVLVLYIRCPPAEKGPEMDLVESV